MNQSAENKLLLIASLAILSLRALTPDGYMPGSPGSGLLYELCPSGMPAGFMQALAGGGHHHHGHGDDNSSAVSGTEQCPIGHMLASAMAADTGPQPEIMPGTDLLREAPVAVARYSVSPAYRSRAPPA